jgi:hypothetical protein
VSSIGTPGSATFAQTLSGIEEMLTVLPDNLANEITAQNVRDVVYTLYEDLQGMSASEFVYTDDPATVTVGGINSGQVFASMSLQTLFNKLFHKDYPPTGSLVASPTTIDFGRSTTVTLTWTATKNTYDLVPSSGLITRSPSSTFGIVVPAAGGSSTVTDTPSINVTNSYTFTFQDTQGNPVSVPASVGYSHRMYWGKVSSRSALTSPQIRALDGAGLSTTNGNFRSLVFNNATGTSKINFNNIDGAGQYLCWAFPSSFGTPTFRTATGIVTMAEKVQSNFSYVNSYSYAVDYDVWITYVAYNSPIAQLDLL